MNLFYVDQVEMKIGKIIQIRGDDAHHIDRVLRLNAGETVLLSNGKGEWAVGSIRNLNKNQVEVELIENGYEERKVNSIAVAQAIPKSDRAKEAIELLTASGVDEIIPWQAARSIGKESEKWPITVRETGKQSRRFWLPIVHEKKNLNQLAELAKEFDQVLVCHESATEQISKSVTPKPRTLIVIGPEGGLTEEEIFALNGKVVRLGNSILRSAHAGIAAISAVSAAMKVW